jgi:Zn-dependent M32 family carboxypeptidase
LNPSASSAAWTLGRWLKRARYSLSRGHCAKTDLDERIERGELKVVTHWLRERVHSQGSRHDAEELVQRVCGHGLRDDEFIGYVRTKYSELCGVAL